MINWKVLTESIRLTDDINLREQTDEDGDVFHWWIHQAKKGVFAAQVNGFLNQSGLHMFESKYLSSKILYWILQCIPNQYNFASVKYLWYCFSNTWLVCCFGDHKVLNAIYRLLSNITKWGSNQRTQWPCTIMAY